MTAPHAKVERLARQLADSRYGAGHYDKPHTHRGYWCRKACWILADCKRAPVHALWSACGWKV